MEKLSWADMEQRGIAVAFRIYGQRTIVGFCGDLFYDSSWISFFAPAQAMIFLLFPP